MKKSMIILLLCVFAISAFSTNMVFMTNNPIPGVDIIVREIPSGTIAFTGQTGKDGKFVCELKEGQYEFNISYSQIERILSNKKLLMSNIEISILLYSKSTNAKENIIAKTSVDKESGALRINIPKGGALISGIISYELKSDGNNTSDDLRNKIINQQPDSPIDILPYTIICWSVANSGIWSCGATSHSCDVLYSSAIYEGSPNVWWECYAIVLTNPDIPILLNREKDGRASFEIDGEITPIASDDFELLLSGMAKEDANSPYLSVSTTRSLQTGTSSGDNAKDDKKRNEIETFLKKDKGVVSDKRLNEISKELGIPITVKK